MITRPASRSHVLALLCACLLAACPGPGSAPQSTPPDAPFVFTDPEERFGPVTPDTFVVEGSVFTLPDVGDTNVAPQPQAVGVSALPSPDGRERFLTRGTTADAAGAFTIALPAAADRDVQVRTAVDGAMRFTTRVFGRLKTHWVARLGLLPTHAVEGWGTLHFIPQDRVLLLARPDWADYHAPARVLHPDVNAHAMGWPLKLPIGAPILPVLAVTLVSHGQVQVVVPKDRWNTLPAPVGDVWRVPLFAWKGDTSGWSPAGQEAWVLDTNGVELPPSAFAAVRDGTRSSAVMLTWAADGDTTPLVAGGVLPRQACVCGAVERAGAPELGQVVVVDNALLGGMRESSVVDARGVFCIQTAPSEQPGEDLDGNGVSGQPRLLTIRLLKNHARVELPPVTAPLGGACLQLGVVTVDQAVPDVPELQTVAGVVMTPQGEPAAGVTVLARDADVDPGEFAATCVGACQVTAITAEDGRFQLVFPHRWHVAVTATRTVVTADSTVVEEARWAATQPSNDVQLLLQPIHANHVLQVVSQAGVVRWEPNHALRSLSVRRQDGVEVWRIFSSDRGFHGPVELGVVPAGTAQAAPMRMDVTADVVVVETLDVTPQGALAQGLGQVALH